MSELSQRIIDSFITLFFFQSNLNKKAPSENGAENKIDPEYFSE
jgi:hypothetical protein